MNIDQLEKMIADGRDSAMLRLTLARLLAADGRGDDAVAHLEAAVELDANYTAAWKELGRIQAGRADRAAARAAWERGIEVARANGDKQAEREMGVFLKRLQRAGTD